VLAVGYQSAGPEPHWVLKNSLGTSWGEQGYLRVAMADSTAYPYGPCGLYRLYMQPTDVFFNQLA